MNKIKLGVSAGLAGAAVYFLGGNQFDPGIFTGRLYSAV